MRTTQTMTVSLPPEMVRRFEAVRRVEQRTRSELVREALRIYFSYFPMVKATKKEINAINKGRAEIKRGEYVTLEELRYDLANSRGKTREKNAY